MNLASDKTLMAYFNINSSDAKKLSQYISDGTTPNHDSINLFIKKINSEKIIIGIFGAVLDIKGLKISSCDVELIVICLFRVNNNISQKLSE